MAGIGATVALIKALAPKADPAVIQQAVEDYLEAHPEISVADGSITEEKLAADVAGILEDLQTGIQNISVTPEMFGAKGDGVTDDSQAVQDAIDAGYNIKLNDNKIYYLEEAVTIDHDIHLIGGENTVIKTKREQGHEVNSAFVVTGTLKKQTTLTTDYKTVGSTDNSGNKFTLSDMEGINIGDILVITATDQYYNLARSSYYLGATLLISDIYDGHIFTSDSMPWNIENTANVTVKVYKAPTVICENINFVSDYDGIGSYSYFIELKHCKNSVIRNCNMTEMDNGIRVYQSVNTLIDCVTLSKSKYDNAIYHDGCAIKIESSTNTIIERILSLCSQGCLNLGGTIPCMNTYVRNCDLSSECRTIGIDMHENSYNIVIEDCVLGGATICGTAIISRCRFIQNSRVGSPIGIVYRGSHEPKWAKIKIVDCEFDGNIPVQLLASGAQSPIRSFVNVYGEVKIIDCKGGQLAYIATTDSTITGNVLKKLLIARWENCEQITHSTGNVIEYMEIVGFSFTRSIWLNKQNNGSSMYFDDIYYLSIHCDNPIKEKIIADLKKYGWRYYLPKDVKINLSSSNQSAHYVVCGKNVASDKKEDYSIGQVSGNVGSQLTRSIYSNFNNALSVDSNGNIVFTQPDSSVNANIYLKCMVYAADDCIARMSLKLKNTGETNAAKFRPYIAIVNCDTGLVTYRGNGTGAEASSEGALITHGYEVPKNSIVLFYVYCYDVVQLSETTFEEFAAGLFAYEDESGIEYEKYNGSYREGDGSLRSVDGLNYIMSTESIFNAKFRADLLWKHGESLPSGEGVSF